MSEQSLSTMDPGERAGVAAGWGADRSFGLMRIAGALVALPLGAMCEVIRGQPAYAGLPLKVDGLIGTIDVRGMIIPVLDLRDALGRATKAGDDHHVVVVMRWQGHVLGLRACDVCGIVRPREEDLIALVTMGARSGAFLATHAFRTGGEVAVVLDIGRIVTRADLPLVAEQVVERRNGAPPGSETILLFTAGTADLAIDATCVDAISPAVSIERNMMSTGVCLGTITHRGMKVPVVDTLAAIGLGTVASANTPVVVVRFGPDALLGFAIGSVSDIMRFRSSEVIAMTSSLNGYAKLFRGVVSGHDGRKRLLLDADRLRAHRDLSALAHLSRPLGHDRRERGRDLSADRQARSREATHPFLTYVAGGVHVTLLSQIVEILAHPADVLPFETGCRGMRGLLTYRGQAVPLICLGTVLGVPVTFDASSARVLIVAGQGDMVGFVVQAVTSIATGYIPSDTAAGRSRLSVSLAILGSGAEERIVSHNDLIAIMRSIGPAAPDAPPPADHAAMMRKAS